MIRLVLFLLMMAPFSSLAEEGRSCGPTLTPASDPIRFGHFCPTSPKRDPNSPGNRLLFGCLKSYSETDLQWIQMIPQLKSTPQKIDGKLINVPTPYYLFAPEKKFPQNRYVTNFEILPDGSVFTKSMRKGAQILPTHDWSDGGSVDYSSVVQSANGKVIGASQDGETLTCRSFKKGKESQDTFSIYELEYRISGQITLVEDGNLVAVPVLNQKTGASCIVFVDDSCHTRGSPNPVCFTDPNHKKNKSGEKEEEKELHLDKSPISSIQSLPGGGFMVVTQNGSLYALNSARSPEKSIYSIEGLNRLVAQIDYKSSDGKFIGTTFKPETFLKRGDENKLPQDRTYLEYQDHPSTWGELKEKVQFGSPDHSFPSQLSPPELHVLRNGKVLLNSIGGDLMILRCQNHPPHPSRGCQGGWVRELNDYSYGGIRGTYVGEMEDGTVILTALDNSHKPTGFYYFNPEDSSIYFEKIPLPEGGSLLPPTLLENGLIGITINVENTRWNSTRKTTEVLERHSYFQAYQFRPRGPASPRDCPDATAKAYDGRKMDKDSEKSATKPRQTTGQSAR